jgi:hypothetical protein
LEISGLDRIGETGTAMDERELRKLAKIPTEQAKSLFFP